ncbi:MAG: UDP-2,3-diacylglucosamine diphosphatase [Acidobacteriota bacterium]
MVEGSVLVEGSALSGDGVRLEDSVCLEDSVRLKDSLRLKDNVRRFPDLGPVLEPARDAAQGPRVDTPRARLHCRTAFLSDLHLGAAKARADELASLLDRLECERLYLVGDILDLWQLRRWRWTAACERIVARILELARGGTRVIFIPGNHDEAARRYVGLEVGGVELTLHAVHETVDGRRLLVTHGDQFDLVIRHSKLLCVLGDVAYEWLIGVNRLWNRMRALCGLPYWSLSQRVKATVKTACTFISRFEEALLHEARRAGLHGVVCGHIHKAEVRTEGDVTYYNCGDWVESCTLLVEHDDGSMEILDGLATEAVLAAEDAALAADEATVPLVASLA